jgi:hypothetical protein
LELSLQIFWTNFFDDYTCVCAENEECNVAFYTESLFRLLGVWFAETGSKAVPFSTSLKPLGLVFDVGNLSAGVFTLQHTETRKAAAELTQAIDKLLADKKSSPKDLERLHGRLIWFSAFIFGRMINQMVKQVSAMSLQRTRVVRSDEIFFQHCIT